MITNTRIFHIVITTALYNEGKSLPDKEVAQFKIPS